MSVRRVVIVSVTCVALLAGGLWAFVTLGTLDKPTIEQRLLSLDKNSRVREIGLSHKRLLFRTGGAAVDAELTYLHVPARAGVPAAPPVVLIHPTPHSLFTWTDVLFGAAGLSGEVDVYALDVVGHGTTRTTAAPYSFQSCSEWVAAALDALGLEQVVLVGQSYGGEFAWRVAVDRPELVAKLVLIDSSGLPRTADEWLPEEIKMREMSLAPIGYALNSIENVRLALRPHFRAPVSDDRVEDVFLVCESPDNWRAMVDLVRDENGARAGDLVRIGCPTLVLWGEDDVALTLERHGRPLAASIRAAQLVPIPDCGHYPQEERPAVVAARILAFARS